MLSCIVFATFLINSYLSTG